MAKKLSKKVRMAVPRGWRCERVNPRMSTPCHACGLPIEKHRFVHTTDSYPFPETHVYDGCCALRVMWKGVTQHKLLVQNVAAFVIEDT